jgi:adenylyltransferase/sulfurtransferase
MLTPEQHARYSKQLRLPEWGEAEQLTLAKSTILVVGAGGLASGALPYLVAAGVGNIVLLDKDTIDLSNLARQTIYATDEVGLPKVEVATKKMKALNPTCNIEAICAHLTSENAEEWISKVDLVVDCTDNFETRYLINDTCVKFQKPFVYAAIQSWEGQFSLLNGMIFEEGTLGPTYRCLFPEEPRLGEIPNCDAAGVMGFLPGIMGALQAKEAIYYLVGWSSPANGALGRFDVSDLSIRFYKMKRSAEADRLPVKKTFKADEVRQLDVLEAAKWLKEGRISFVLDVREPEEWELASLQGSIQLSMGNVLARANSIPGNQPGLVLCHHGMRSAFVIKQLQQIGFTQLYNLEGGIDAWSRYVDEAVPRYY